MLCKQEYIGVAAILAVTLVTAIGLARYLIFGNSLGVAYVTFAMVTLVYLGSFIVSKLSWSCKLKKHNSTHQQLNPKLTSGGIVRTVSFALIIGGMSFIASYLSPETVEYSDLNFIMIVAAISAVPTVAVALSWFDS